MSASLKIEGTEETPNVMFEKESSTFEISGRSYPEDAHSFYEPIIKWLMDYSESPSAQTHLVVDLEYFNSGSVKKVFNMLYIIEDIMETGKDAKVIWRHKKGDELMQQKGLEFQKFLQVPVDVIEY
jgi:SiaC family regulatory phosphoprotein